MKLLTTCAVLIALTGCAQEEAANTGAARKKYGSGNSGGTPAVTPAPVTPGTPAPVTPGTPAPAPVPGAPTPAPAPATLNIVEKAPKILPDTLAELDIYSNKGVLNAKIPFFAYDVISPLWSDGAVKSRYMLLPKDGKITAAQFTNAMVFPAGTIFVKHFTSDNAEKTPVETRLILRKPNLTWDYATYKWNPDGTTKRVIVAETIMANDAWPKGYRIPAENECMKCHNPNVLDVIGFRSEQLKGVLEKLAETNVIAAADLALFQKAVPQIDARLPTLTPQQKALAYLQVNCAQCHQPSGLKSSLPLTAKNLDWPLMLKSPGTSTGDIIADSPVITPGHPELSKLYLRYTAVKSRMPAVSVYPDPVGDEAIKNWILSLPATCTAAAPATCMPAAAIPAK